MRTVPNAGPSPFAHLAASGRRGARAETDDEREDKDKELRALEDKGEDTGESEDEREARHGREAARAKKAEEDKKKEDEAKRAEEDKQKEEEARRADEDGDDDTDRDDEDDAGMRAAHRRWRGRARAIILSDAGKANPVGAMHLALETSMPRDQAIGMLAAFGGNPGPASPRSDALRDRMIQVPNPEIGDGGPSPAPNLAAQIVAAGKKRRGEI